MKVSDEVNGGMPDTKEESAPRAQRRPKLNRRSFYLSNHPLKALLSDDSEKQTKNVNGLNCSSTNKSSDSAPKRSISLISIKSSTSSSVECSENAEKKESSGEGKRKISDSEDPPSKKKHKPITWP